MSGLLRAALAGMGARRSRALLAAAGVFAAALVTGVAATTGFGLATGFDRAAERADLPDVLARFDRDDRRDVDERVRALPNVRSRSYRLEVTNLRLRAGGRRTRQGVVHVVLGGRRGYAVTEGRDLGPAPGEVLVERGLADAWDLEPGDPLRVQELGELTVAGVVLSPDNVAFPLAKTARVYVGEQEIRERFGPDARPEANVALHAAEAALVAVPAAALGLGLGGLAAAGPSGDLLSALNEEPPGGALLGVLAVCWAVVVAVSCAAAALPAWRAARRPVAEVLRGGDTGTRPARSASARAVGSGLAGTGARFALAARGRWAGSVATLSACAGVVLLMLALASLLERLRDDPGTLGKRFQLTVRAEDYLLPSIRRVDGVEAAVQRWTVTAAHSFRLGEPVRLIAYREQRLRFEAPPLAEGRRVRGANEAEIGAGLAEALGLRPGGTLAVQAPGGTELRYRVAGIVRALENDGRVAYVDAGRLLDAEPDLQGSVVVRLRDPDDRDAVIAGLRELDVEPQRAGGAVTRDGAFLGVLAAVLRAVGLAVGLVCLYALVQVLATTARERRGAIAVLRAAGAGPRDVRALLGGAAAAVAIPAALAAIALETLVFGPAVARLAAGYAELPLTPSPLQALAVAGGLSALAAVAASLVARRAIREPVIAGLREE